MSEHPLSPQNSTIIIAAANNNQVDDALLQYGTDAQSVTVVRCFTTADAVAARGSLPPETPWCILAHADSLVVAALSGVFGASRTLAKCLDMRNNDYAISPKRFM